MFFPPFANQLLNPNYKQPLSFQIELPTESKVVPQIPHTPSLSTETIQCHIKDCNKTFRKQSLLEYHLKYHHYVSLELASPLIQLQNQYLNQQQQQQDTASTSKRSAKRATRLSTSSNHTTNKDSLSVVDDDLNATMQDEEPEDSVDPYEVINCQCGKHTSEGFMIQCEICMCWQHGSCAEIKTAESVPKHYLCWICKDPGNKLRKLKYQSWMNGKQSSLTEGGVVAQSRNDPEHLKLRLLNECSRRYYNLNLLMYTLEYQMSMFENLTKNIKNPCVQTQLETDQNKGSSAEMSENTWAEVEKLGLNVEHLQGCLSKKFAEFNVKIDGKFRV